MATRVRKAFRYPSEDDDDDLDELDEEHQEQLIADLQEEDARKNDIYRRAFLVIPIACIAFFLYSFTIASTARHRLIVILAISSLSCTAYILHYMPVAPLDRKGKRPVYQVEAEKSPLDKYLPYLNGILIVLLQLAAVLSWRRGAGDEAWRETLPAIIFGLTMFARQQLAPLDLQDLQKARYELKGA